MCQGSGGWGHPSSLLLPVRLREAPAPFALLAKAAWVLLGKSRFGWFRGESYRHLAGPLLILHGAGTEPDPRQPQLPHPAGHLHEPLLSLLHEVVAAGQEQRGVTVKSGDQL